MKDFIKNVWEKSKGKIAIGVMTLLLAIPAATGFLGIEEVPVENATQVEGTLCFAATQPEVAVETVEEAKVEDAKSAE